MNVTLTFAPWAGEHQVPLKDAKALLLRGVEVDGVAIEATSVSLSLDWFSGMRKDSFDFTTLWIKDPPPEVFNALTRNADDYAYGSTRESLGVIATELNVVYEDGDWGHGDKDPPRVPVLGVEA